MKTKINGLLLAAIVALGALTACSEMGEADVLDAVGNNESVMLIDGDKICASAGVSSASDLKTLPGSDAKDLQGLVAIEGIRVDRIAVIKPGGTPLGVAAVTDRGKVEKSLGRLGYKKEDNGGDEVFTSPDSRVSYQLDDSYLWMARASASKLGRMVDGALKDANKAPLEQWKRKMLASGKAITGIQVEDDSSEVMSYEVELHGPKLVFEILSCDKSGKPCDVFSVFDAEPIDASYAAEIDDNATLAFALGKADFGALLKEMKKVGQLPVSARDIAAVAALTNGPAFGYITLPDTDFTDFESIECNIRLKTNNGTMASLALSQIGRELNGFGAKRDGSDRIEMRLFGNEPYAELLADGDWLVARTVDAGKGRFKAMRESDLKGCLGLIKFNISKEMIKTATDVDAFGVKGVIRIEASGISGEVELKGTSEPFLAAFIDAASRR